jgi:hypothetical protein
MSEMVQQFVLADAPFVFEGLFHHFLVFPVYLVRRVFEGLVRPRPVSSDSM